MRDRRFPWIATLVVFALAGVIAYLTVTMDGNLPQHALTHVGRAIEGVGHTISLIGKGGVTIPSQTPRTQLSLPVLVNAQNPVPDGYRPNDLVRMKDYCDPNVVLIKADDTEGQRTAVDALMEMFRAAIAEGIGSWQISAGYRSTTYQQQVWDDKVAEYRQQGLEEDKAQQATAQYVAKPGASEHHTGLAFDVTVPGQSFASTEQSKWLAEHCWEYGFVIRYQADKAGITGIQAEPWHVRYVGLPHSLTMRDNNWCLEEYLLIKSTE